MCQEFLRPDPMGELINTGVLVLNAARWQRERGTARLLQYLRENGRYVQPRDPDAMNAVFRGE